MRLLAIDPGNVESAWVRFDGQRVIDFRKCENSEIIADLSGHTGYLDADHLAIETLHARGMPTAQEEMEMQLWAGRFIQAFDYGPFTKVRRIDEKITLCGSARAKDGNIRQALIDRFGGKEKAIGKKKTPGPLYGVSGDVWQALAIAVTWFELHYPKLKSA